MEQFTIRTLRAVAAAVGIPLELWPRVPAAEVTRLLDEGHASVVEKVLALLRRHGWETIAEYTFSHYGERGAVDIVGWYPHNRTVLIVEVKTQLIDVQELMSTLDRKCRLVPQLVARERGWDPHVVARLVVVEEGSAARRIVAEHRVTFDSTFPARSRGAQRWIRRPDGPLAGLWFLPVMHGGRANRRRGAVQRVRRASNGD